MTARRRVTVAERRARLGRRHHLAPACRAADPVSLARSLAGLHGTDPPGVFIAAWARLDGFRVEQLEHALYEERSLTKHLCMRRTLFVLPDDVRAEAQSAASDAVAANERRKLIADVEAGGITDDGAAWLRVATQAALDGIARLGSPTGSQLTRAVPELQAKLTVGEGKKWGGTVGVTTRVLTILSAEGRIRRGRPASWTSSRHRWEPARPLSDLPDAATATTGLVRRWLAAFGPGTETDLAWWTGLGLLKVRAALAALGVVEVDVELGDGTVSTGYLLSDDLDRVTSPGPWAAFLPWLDPATMGWKQRDWYVGPHADAVFDTAGNGGPTVWWNGRIVGGWAQLPDGAVVHRLLEDVGSDAGRAIERRGAQLQAWLDGTVVVPRFPAPLEKALRA
ncbi:MAG TPA: winged helix DNA-binding domain-containing protein [Microthrixaceae bacterium]|nr:winged helix DNA-binding domain-containing protein [Microthrixaceae bacterium]